MKPTDIGTLERVAATVRGLSADGVNRSTTGHPGMPLGCAEIGAALYGAILKHDPQDPQWPNRDRFVLSAGHGSIWLYSLLHLSGYDLPLDELKRLRRLGSKTPGHPEYGMTPGVETTTGPLGAGFATAVGMALAEAKLAHEFNTPGARIVDHHTFVLAGDGCMMEGVASEAASLAGHLKLGKLIVLYDSNSISIEGRTDITFTEDVAARYRAYGWHTLSGDGHSIEDIVDLVEQAKAEQDRPTLIALTTTIGFGAPHMADHHKVHGTVLGEEETRALKEAIGLPPDQEFYVPEEVRSFFAEKAPAWKQTRQQWRETYETWSSRNPELRQRLEAFLDQGRPYYGDIRYPHYQTGQSKSTRDAGGEALEAIFGAVPNMIGGSADLSKSNKTEVTEGGVLQPDNLAGRLIRFGVREHAMASIVNGITLHGGYRAFAATLFVFVDYMRPAMRLAALMKLPAIYVLTHDSFYLGGDGPTHQPVEHLNSLRIIPNMWVLRPGDPEEAVEAWKMALDRIDGPVALVLSRQGLATYQKDDPDWRRSIRQGGYEVRHGSDEPDLVLLATGSEVELAIGVAQELQKRNGYAVRVISVLSRELFAQQETSYRGRSGPPRFVLEAGSRCGWTEFTGGDRTAVLSIDDFGESGRPEELAEHFGFTVAAMADRIEAHPGSPAGPAREPKNSSAGPADKAGTTGGFQ